MTDLRARSRARRMCTWITGAAVIVALLAAGSAPARLSRIAITRSGRIGSLRVDVSTGAAIERAWGPAYESTGNVTGSENGGYPDYVQYGYGCRSRSGSTTCATNFYVSQRTGRLESFTTTSPRFVLFGGVRVGMSANLASRREHRPNLAGCGQLIYVTTPRLQVAIWTRGGHAHESNHSEVVSGGRVASLGLDERPHGVGVLFC